MVNGKLYAIGGRVNGNSANNLDVNEVYDPGTNTWSRLAPLPTARSGIAAAVLGERIYVFGGENPEMVFNENEAYETASNTWTRLAPLPTARHGLGAVTFGGVIYVLAGGTRPGLSASTLNEVFAP